MRSLTVILGCLTVATTCPAQTPNWTQIKPSSSPSPRYSHAMAYDSARQRVVLFGGWTSRYIRNDTWEWDGRNWTLIKPTNSPSIRYSHAMAYDSARRRTVLFGGSGRSGHLADTWEWDGKNWALSKPANSPSGRRWHAMAYDAARKRVVLFSGWGNGCACNDTWEWDGKNWTLIMLASSPAPRTGHAMVYDAARQRTVLFGGYGLADTWEWDGKNWTQGKPLSSPPARWQHAMAYDSARRRTVLFGGRGRGGSPELGDTWEWDGKNWTLMNSVLSPAPRASHAMAYDAARQRTVLFGGYDKAYSNILGDTWEYGVAKLTLTANTPTISIANGGTQTLTLNAGADLKSKSYWIFGSATSTMPGVVLTGIHIPLNPDIYTDIAIGAVNSNTFSKFRGTLSATGSATASFNVPAKLPIPSGFKLYHAYLVYDGTTGQIFTSSNPVSVEFK